MTRASIRVDTASSTAVFSRLASRARCASQANTLLLTKLSRWKVTTVATMTPSIDSVAWPSPSSRPPLVVRLAQRRSVQVMTSPVTAPTDSAASLV